FKLRGEGDAIESSDENPSGTKTLRTHSGQSAVFQSQRLMTEGLVLAALTNGKDLTIGFHVQVPADAQIMLDGKRFDGAGVSQLHFQDLESSPNNVQIRSTREATVPEVQADYGRSVPSGAALQHIATVSIDLGNIKTEVLRLGKIGRTAILPAITTVRDLTFIPEAWVNAPYMGCADATNYDFKGDNRSWSSSSSSYRTKFDVSIDWNGGPALSSMRSVGETSLWLNFFGNRTLTKAATASNSTMTLTLISKTNSSVSFKMYQDVKNPICLNFVTNGIFFNLNWNVSRLGSYSVQGTYMPVPNHEAYVSSGGSSAWVAVFQTEHQSFACLMALVTNCTTTRANGGTF
ncbi:MAG: DUF3238 domain-containing protein, partial [Rhodoluna sp.]